MGRRMLAVCLTLAGAGWLGAAAGRARPAAKGGPAATGYRVLAPIRHEGLTVFPVVAATWHDTADFLTLDEGLRSGEVVVTEYGRMGGMIRRWPGRPGWPQPGSPEVNRLMLINNAKRPLLLLAGEIVTGGQQDRVVGQDIIVAPESDPLPLDVFCVEPGRWVGSSDKFESMKSAMAAPGVRGTAMGEKNQGQVWAEVGRMQNEVIGEVAGGTAGGAPEAAELRATTSYAQVMNNQAVAKKVESIAAPVEESYRSLIEELRNRKAVGVVVAVGGRIVWADLFASTDLLERYWGKLVRSYAAEAMVGPASGAAPSEESAQAYLDALEGTHETVDIEPGLYRRVEITGEGYKVFELSSLLPKEDFVLHIAKMGEEGPGRKVYRMQ